MGQADTNQDRVGKTSSSRCEGVCHMCGREKAQERANPCSQGDTAALPY